MKSNTTQKRSYLSIPPQAILPGTLPDFRIYLATSAGQYTLWARDGNRVTPEQLARLSETGIEEVFVDLEEQFKYEQYLESNLKNILENPTTPDNQKAAIFSRVSTSVVRASVEASLRLGTMGPSALERTQQFIENSLLFIKEAKSLPALAKMIGHDYQTYEHATKVLWFAVAFLECNQDILGKIPPETQRGDETQKNEILKQCGVAALLHDIGKAFVPQDILAKKEPLTAVEWEIMKGHSLNGLAMLIDTDIPLYVKKAVLQHHEDFQGGGYPLKLSGTSISILARLLRIVDVFDAMTSRRPYKEAIEPRKAVEIMIGIPKNGKISTDDPTRDVRDFGMRKCFDPDLLERFIIFLGRLRFDR